MIREGAYKKGQIQTLIKFPLRGNWCTAYSRQHFRGSICIMHVFLESNCRITGGLDASGVPSRFVGSSTIYALYMLSPIAVCDAGHPQVNCFLISAKLVSASLLLWTMPPPNLLLGASSSKHVSFPPLLPSQQFSAAHSFADLHSFSSLHNPPCHTDPLHILHFS